MINKKRPKINSTCTYAVSLTGILGQFARQFYEKQPALCKVKLNSSFWNIWIFGNANQTKEYSSFMQQDFGRTVRLIQYDSYSQTFTCNEQMIENSLNLLYVLLYKCHKSVKALFHFYQMVETKKKPKELILELWNWKMKL